MRTSVRILLTLLACAAIVGATVFFAVLPLRKRAVDHREHIRERRGQLVKLQRVAARISDLEEEVERLEGALDFFDNRLPEKRDIDGIVQEVSVIARDSQLAERSVRAQDPEVLPRYGVQTITMELEGPFDGFYRFLLDLEQLPRITKLRQMLVQKSPNEEGGVRAELTVDIFFERQP